MIETALELLKLDLQITSSAYDGYLEHLIESAIDFIRVEGIALDSDVGDIQLVVMYAAYLFRRRTDEKGAGMPRMLRYALNNKLFAQKAGE